MPDAPDSDSFSLSRFLSSRNTGALRKAKKKPTYAGFS
jgi:hypothetical protein